MRSDEDIGLPERGQYAGFIPGSVPGDDRSRSNPPFKGGAVDDEARVGDDDFHCAVFLFFFTEQALRWLVLRALAPGMVQV